MDRYRQVAFISAFILALVIMMVGKACTDSTMKKRNKPIQTSTQQTTPVQNFNSYNNYNNIPQQTTVPVQTTPPVNYITNMFGEIVGIESIETVPEIQEATKERSILEQYNEDKQQNNGEILATNNYQTPSEVNITIH